MKGDASWVSILIGVTSALVSVGITSIVNCVIARKNREIQTEIANKELSLKENIEYHKLAIGHTTMVIKQLIDWNINYNAILLLKKKLVIAEFNKNDNEVYDLTNKISELINEMSNNLTNLYVFVSDKNRDEIDKHQTELTEKLSKTEYQTNNFMKSSIQLGTLSEVHTIVLSEIGNLKRKIDSKVLKYLE